MMSAVQAWLFRILRIDKRDEERRREREETNEVRKLSAASREEARGAIGQGVRVVEEATGNPLRDMLLGSYEGLDRRSTPR